MKPAASAVLIVALAVGSGGVVGGCAPWATYPPDEGGLDLSGPRTEPVPTLMIQAVLFMDSRYGTGDDFAINLPPGTPSKVYEWVIRRVGSGHPMEDPQERAYHVTKVRVRGLKAQVDVFYPKRPGEYQFATLSFQGDMIRGYELEGTRLWHTGDLPPPPGHVAQPAGPPDLAEPGATAADARESGG